MNEQLNFEMLRQFVMVDCDPRGDREYMLGFDVDNSELLECYAQCSEDEQESLDELVREESECSGFVEFYS